MSWITRSTRSRASSASPSSASRRAARDVVQGEQHVERDADGGVVVNDQYVGMACRSITCGNLRRCGWRWPAKCWPRARPGRRPPIMPSARTRCGAAAGSRAGRRAISSLLTSSWFSASAQQHAGEHAGAGDHEVLGHEVAQDVAPARTQRAAHADLLAALRDPQAGHADDAAGGNQQQQHADGDQHPRQARRRGSGLAVFSNGLGPSARPVSARPCAAPPRLPSSRGRAGPARRARCTARADSRRCASAAMLEYSPRSPTFGLRSAGVPPRRRCARASSPVPKYMVLPTKAGTPGHSFCRPAPW
jgi:hypothetical protein